MKLIVSILMIGAAFVGFSQETEINEPIKGAKIYFEVKSHDFGDIVQGDVVEHSFEFKNTGNEPLILSDVRTTCGCTAPEWPREPVAPGKNATLKVVFNSAGKIGTNIKVITVMSNAVNNPETVKIVTNILAKTPGERN